jgi:SsrA-binding protein
MARSKDPIREEDALIAENRKAFFDYHILETFEAGIALLGTEVKGIREGRANLRDAYARVEKGEVWLYNVHINPYSHRGYVDHDPKRKRGSCCCTARDPQADWQDGGERPHAGPHAHVFQERQGQGGHRARAGKQVHDKRETIKRRETERETRAAVKERVRR